MAKQVKKRQHAFRVSDALDEQIAEYIESENLTVAELARNAVIEYMRNHPAKVSA